MLFKLIEMKPQKICAPRNLEQTKQQRCLIFLLELCFASPLQMLILRKARNQMRSVDEPRWNVLDWNDNDGVYIINEEHASACRKWRMNETLSMSSSSDHRNRTKTRAQRFIEQVLIVRPMTARSSLPDVLPKIIPSVEQIRSMRGEELHRS